MSPLKKEVLYRKLEKLSNVIRKLEQHRTKMRDVEMFLSNETVQDAVLRNLALGIEIIIDIGNHLLAEHFQKSATTYREIMLVLGELGVFPKEFAEKHVEMTGFRNIVIHDYEEVSLEKVYSVFREAPDIFRQCAEYYVEFLETLERKKNDSSLFAESSRS